ncbi:MAG: 2-phosphosulfolactate phosphatase [Symbiobacteriaceae bacterium]|nr:2-phosphosulfolactate phosphatase [Symbiobacteriaceae bacterium]
MQLQVTASAAEAAYLDLSAATAVVIDVLRATTVITTAIHNGAQAIYPTVEVEEAITLAGLIRQQHPQAQVLLGGERGAKLIPGFDLANSPWEYTAAKVAATHIVITTSNGTRALHEAQRASAVWIGSLLNAAAVAQTLASCHQVTLICSGTANLLDISDCLAAGAIIHELQSAGVTPVMNDLALICQNYFQPESYQQRLYASLHGQRLIALGLDADLRYCGQLNIINTVPFYDGTKITSV